MAVIQKVIFVCRDNLCQSPVAEVIMKEIKKDEWLDVESRGMVVLFPEPYSLKAHNLLRNNGIVMGSGTARQLEQEDFSPNTLILTMNREQKQKIIAEYEHTENVYSIMEFAGGNGDIVDPYGGDTDLYSMFYASIRSWVDQVEMKIHKLNAEEDEK